VTPKVSVLVTTLLADVLAAHEQTTTAGAAADADMVDAAAGAAAGGDGGKQGEAGSDKEAGDAPRKVHHEWWASMVFVETRVSTGGRLEAGCCATHPYKQH
jgi:hypothetical protein